MKSEMQKMQSRSFIRHFSFCILHSPFNSLQRLMIWGETVNPALSGVDF